MKLLPTFLILFIGLASVPPQAVARGDRAIPSKPTRTSRASGMDKRSPMTGSKIERPASKPAPKPAYKPAPKPASKPAPKPAARPEAKPAQRLPERPSVQRPTVQRPTTLPGSLPDRRPEINRPATLPGNLPDRRPDISLPATRPEFSRPDQRPSLQRPVANRPTTLPGMVTYPSRPTQRPNIDRDSIRIGDRNNVNIGQVNVDRRNVNLNRPVSVNANTRNWNSNQWGGNRSVWGNNVNVNINNNFRYSNNFSYRPNYWGARPWWGAGHCYGWHHGHWGYGWNSAYYRRHWYYADHSFASGFMWGIAVWSLGNLIYDMGYHSYQNPYPAPVVQNTYITYTQPVSVAAAANPPGDEKSTELAETQSNHALERSRAAFKIGDYTAAAKWVDEAIAHTPGDVTLHEYRALVFFALGKFADAAGILNPVLASGPGWSWETMVGFYDSSLTYSNQLRRLETYVQSASQNAAASFLLGYHYMVCGHMEKANEVFSVAAQLQPADSISRQLRDLTAASIPDVAESVAEESAAEAPAVDATARPDPVSLEQLVGTWNSDRGENANITFTMQESGDYTWSFKNGGEANELKGTYGLDDQGLLVLSSDDTQMVCLLEIKEGNQMHFTLIGAPDGDPGLDFTKI
jgi:tetratricopeptide (TPR) repeat protein